MCRDQRRERVRCFDQRGGGGAAGVEDGALDLGRQRGVLGHQHAGLDDRGLVRAAARAQRVADAHELGARLRERGQRALELPRALGRGQRRGAGIGQRS